MGLLSALLDISPHQTTIEGMLNDIAADVFSSTPAPARGKVVPAPTNRGDQPSWYGQAPSWSDNDSWKYDPTVDF